MNIGHDRDAAFREAKELMRKSIDQLQTWSMCMYIGGVSFVGGFATGWLIPFADVTDDEKRGWALWIMAAAAVVLIIGFASKSASNEKFRRAHELADQFGFDNESL